MHLMPKIIKFPTRTERRRLEFIRLLQKVQPEKIILAEAFGAAPKKPKKRRRLFKPKPVVLPQGWSVVDGGLSKN